jgi:hypothetical protein
MVHQSTLSFSQKNHENDVSCFLGAFICDALFPHLGLFTRPSTLSTIPLERNMPLGLSSCHLHRLFCSVAPLVAGPSYRVVRPC